MGFALDALAIQGAPPSRLRVSRWSLPSWAKPLAAGVAGIVAIVGLLFVLASQAYGVRPQAAFACPPETSEAVQAATGCVMPVPDQDRWRGIP